MKGLSWILLLMRNSQPDNEFTLNILSFLNTRSVHCMHIRSYPCAVATSGRALTFEISSRSDST